MTVVLDGRSLTRDEVVRVARREEGVELARDALDRLRRARALVDRTLARGDAVYGLTTGVGAQKRFTVEVEDEVWFNRRLLDNHHVGVGPNAPREVVRAQVLRLLNGCAGGHVAVRPAVAERLSALLNEGPLPFVHLLGSLGQSDLAPNAEIARVVFDGLDPAPGETLSLINNNAFATGYAALAVADALRLLDATDAVGALALEAYAANAGALDPAVAQARPHHGLHYALTRLRHLLAGSFVLEPGTARNLQDPLSFRNMPQQQGAARDVLDHAASVLSIELNAAQNNPLLVLSDGPAGASGAPEGLGDERIVSAGEYEVLPLAAALDYARIGLAPLLTSVAERTMKLLDRPWSGLPTGLVPEDGTVESGLSHFAITAEAVAAEARLLAQPVSFELVSTSGAEGIEDRMTMAPLAARRLADMVGLGERLLAIALLVAAQAVELRGRAPLGTGTGRLFALTRERSPFMGARDPLPAGLEGLCELVASGALSEL